MFGWRPAGISQKPPSSDKDSHRQARIAPDRSLDVAEQASAGISLSDHLVSQTGRGKPRLHRFQGRQKLPAPDIRRFFKLAA
jgi:hypothetical protein